MLTLTLANLILIVTTASAESCPNISGIFQLTETAVMKLEQSDCSQLTKSMAVRKEGDTSLRWFGHQNFQLDGTPICNARNACDSATATAGGILFESNYDSSVLTADHGRCSHNGYKAVKLEDGNLSAQFRVFRCKDGFSGTSTKIFSKY